MSGRIGDSLASAVKRAGALHTTAAASAANAVSRVPSVTSASLAALWFAAGGLLLFLAIFVALPVIVLSPTKFATTFTLGCLCVLAGLCSLFGWRAQLAAAASREQAPLSAAYCASAVLTLWAALSAHSYLLSLLFSGVQVVALCVWGASFVPGGAHGVRLLASTAARAATSFAAGLLRRG